MRPVMFSSIALQRDGIGYYPGNDKNIHKWDYEGKAENNDKYPVDVNLSQVALPSSNKLLFGGIQDKNKSSGSIRCYPVPLNAKPTDYPAHDNKGIEKMRITSDDKYIITAGRDGCVQLFEIKDKDARGMKFDK